MADRMLTQEKKEDTTTTQNHQQYREGAASAKAPATTSTDTPKQTDPEPQESTVEDYKKVQPQGFQYGNFPRFPVPKQKQYYFSAPSYFPKDGNPIVAIHKGTAPKLTTDEKKLVVDGKYTSYFKQDQKLELHGTQGQYLKVKNTASYYKDASGGEKVLSKSPIRYVLIKRSDTNLKENPSSDIERNSIDGDINMFYDNQVVKALLNYEFSMNKVANHYRKAHEVFNAAITTDAETQALKEKVMWNVLSAVSVGALGGLGELFSSVKAGMKFSEALWGGLEDTLQSLVGNGINLGPDFFSGMQYSTNTSPQDFKASSDEFILEIKKISKAVIGKVREDVKLLSAKPDRAEVLLGLYSWYSSKLIPKTYLRPPDWNQFQLNIEKGFWSKYIIDEMQDGGGYDTFAQRDYITYDDPGSETKKRWKETGIISASGADYSTFFQDVWTQRTETVYNDPQGRRNRIWDGNAETRKVVHWALKYNPRDDAHYF